MNNNGIKAATRIGGKGTPRRKISKKPTASTATINEERKLASTTKKLGVQPIPAIEEVNLFQEDGNIIHFKNPQVRASVPCNTFIIGGNAEVKEITELVPGILDQLGPVSISSLKKIADAYRTVPTAQTAGDAACNENGDADEEQDDEIPDLVGNADAQLNE